jgi:hypothetical protein
MVATIVRVVPIRLIEISRGGCRFESPARLEPGASGTLTIEVDGVDRIDDVRVARCQRLAGGNGSYQVGAELLKTKRLGRRSVRLAVKKIIGDVARGAGQPSGATGKPRTMVPWASEKGLQAVGRAPPAGPDRGS